MTSQGARLNNKNYKMYRKRKKPAKCVVCLKALRGENKSGFCSIHKLMELNLGSSKQKIYKK